MAANTPNHVRNLVIYEIYVRSHGRDGTFANVAEDLERIRSMAVDVVWFMPIHPIGKVARKGTMGSPYSIVDYRAVNPEYGTMEDFTRMVERAHSLGLQVWIDVVYNHTAHDSLLVQAHPEWYHQDENGVPVTTVPEWSDVIDLVYPNPELEDYLIETLKGWVRAGVDGFRCDVASLLPEEFWVRARREVAEVNPRVTWLAESTHAAFLEMRRHVGLSGLSDSQVYSGFDITYPYDIYTLFQAAVRENQPDARYLEMLRFQDAIYPPNFAKLRYVENHDQPRIMELAPSPRQALAWTAFEAFNKGPFLIYAGQESAAAHRLSLFEVDKIDWNDYSLQPFLTKLAALKKHPALMGGEFLILESQPLIQAAWSRSGGSLYGVFNTHSVSGDVETRLPDGEYRDELTGEMVRVQNGRIPAPESACILNFDIPIHLQPFYSTLMDYRV